MRVPVLERGGAVPVVCALRAFSWKIMPPCQGLVKVLALCGLETPKGGRLRPHGWSGSPTQGYQDGKFVGRRAHPKGVLTAYCLLPSGFLAKSLSQGMCNQHARSAWYEGRPGTTTSHSTDPFQGPRPVQSRHMLDPRSTSAPACPPSMLDLDTQLPRGPQRVARMG